jgi:hypothetical protein
LGRDVDAGFAGSASGAVTAAVAENIGQAMVSAMPTKAIPWTLGKSDFIAEPRILRKLLFESCYQASIGQS